MKLAIPILFGSALGSALCGLFSTTGKVQSVFLLICVVWAMFTWFSAIRKGKI